MGESVPRMESAREAVSAAFAAMEAHDWLGFTRLADPAALEEWRQGAEAFAPEALDPSVPTEALYARVLELGWRLGGGAKFDEAGVRATRTLLAEVPEGDDTVHVVYRVALASKEDEGLVPPSGVVTVVTARARNDGWRVVPNEDLSRPEFALLPGIRAAVRASTSMTMDSFFRSGELPG